MSETTTQPPRTETTTSTTPGKTPPPPKRRACLRWGCIGLIAVTLLIIAGFIALRVITKSRYSDQQWQQIENFETEVISLPEPWHQPATLPPLNVVAFQQRFSTSLDDLLTSYSDLFYGTATADGILTNHLNVPIPDEQRTSFSELLTYLEPLIDATSHTVRLTGYTPEMDLYSAGQMDLLNYQIFAKLVSIYAHEQARNGNCIKAMELAALPLRTLNRAEQSYSITHLVAVATSWYSVYTLFNLAGECNNVAALRHGLALLTELREPVFPGDIKNWHFTDPLVALRYASANGYPVDLKPQPLADYYRQLDSMAGSSYYDWIINNLPASDPRVEVAKQRIISRNEWNELAKAMDYPQSPEPAGWKERLQSYVTGVDSITSRSVLAAPAYDDFLNRSYTALAHYDLTRLYFAQSLAKVDASCTTLTAYLSPIPHDPFTSAPFPFSQTTNQFYSVGPDKTDDKAAIDYDVTNGTISTGDIWMESK